MPTDPQRPTGARRASGGATTGGGASKLLIGALLAVLVAVAMVLIIRLTGGGDGSDAAADDPSQSTESVDTEEIDIPQGASEDGRGITVGEPGNPVLTLFEDFQCPACEAFEAEYGEELTSRVEDGSLQVTYRIMNFLDANLGTDHSTRAANAGFCAADQDAFLPFHDVVFANQPESEGDGWSDDELKSFGEEAGLSGQAYDTFAGCVDEGTYTGYAQLSQQVASEDGIQGTPSVFLNGEALEYSIPEDFWSAIEEAEAPESPAPSASES